MIAAVEALPASFGPHTFTGAVFKWHILTVRGGSESIPFQKLSVGHMTHQGWGRVKIFSQQFFGTEELR